MTYNGVKKPLTNLLPFGQGVTLCSKLVIVKPVRHKIFGISIGQTTRIIQHEMKHVEQIKSNGWLKFMFRTLKAYMRGGVFAGRYEEEARKAEEGFNPEVADKLIQWCDESGIKCYW